MKLTTFIKSYKIALSGISEKVSSWPSIYLGQCIFPDKSNPEKISFIFSTGHAMQPGDMGISASVSVKAVEQTAGGLNSIAQMTADALDKDVMAREYINQKEKINEAGRVMVLLETLLTRLQALEPDTWEDAVLNDIAFNFDKDLANFRINNSDIYTNGSLVLFG